jgi:cystathionine beta-lyase family protein involved in aluminum resistance
VSYRELPLAACGSIDWGALEVAVVPGKTKVVHVQRSCGYALRPTLSIEEIERVVKMVKAQVRALLCVCACACVRVIVPGGVDGMVGALLRGWV